MAQILHQNTLVLQSEIEALLRFNAAAFGLLSCSGAKPNSSACWKTWWKASACSGRPASFWVEVSGRRTTLQLDPEKNRLGRGQPAVQRHSLFTEQVRYLGRFARPGSAD